jgi:glutathione peroxidase
LGKIECENGDKTHALFVYLKSSLPAGWLGRSLKWNFEKFLCDKDGQPVKRFGPMSGPLSFEKDLKELLDK